MIFVFNILNILFFNKFVLINCQNGYHSWLVGNPADFKLPDESVLTGGVLLAGGSTDQDSAMNWFLSKALGGDVIVFRNGRNASVAEYPTADGYNNYLYSELNVKVDSVETIFLNSRDVANNLEVVDKVMKAEAVFFSGGDQAFYYSHIQNSLLQDALDYLINTKRAVIGGTSAGCAIQGEFGFTAEFDTILSNDALKNPFDKRITIGRNLLKHKYLKNTIADTHYNNPDRRGRHIAFMSRIYNDYLSNSLDLVRGIGVDEKTAVCIESNGHAKVFGRGTAFFIQQADLLSPPESCLPNRPLDWYRDKKALRVYRVNANTYGDRYFDLSNWDKGLGGSWSNFYVDQGYFATN